MATGEEEVLNVLEAAKLLGISERTMRRLIAERSVPFARVGGSLRLRRTALMEWLKEQEQRSLRAGSGRSASGRSLTRSPSAEKPDREERAARVRSIVGKYAHVPFSSEDLIRERRAEAEAEERCRQMRCRSGPGGGSDEAE